MTLKTKSKLVFILILIIAIAVGYFWFTMNVKKIQEAKESIQKAEQYDELVSRLVAERDRCKEFIAEQTGNFGDFEYCQKYGVWVEGVLK